MQQNRRIVAFMLLLVIVTSIFSSRTLSRFATIASSEDNARVAVWGINEGTATMDLFNGEYKTTDDEILLAKSNDDNNIIAPGLTMESPFKIINYIDNDIKPEVAYKISINLDDSEISDEIKNNLSIQWRLDDNDWGTWDTLKSSILSLSGDECGTYIYPPGMLVDAFKKDVIHKIAWQWIDDNNNDTEDTDMGNDVFDKNISANIKIDITAEQSDFSDGLLEGANQLININDVESISIRSLAPLSELKEVKVNGEVISSDNYTATEGSTIITLHKDYLEKFGLGTYSIDIVSENVTASTNFTVGPSKILSENSWALISDVVKMGKASDYWSVGDKTTVDVNGKDYVVAIAGFDHDGEDTVTFTFTEKVKNATMSSNSTWVTTSVRTTVLPEILSQMENKDYIIEVEKKTVKGFIGSGDNTTLEILTTNDKLFLPSWRELINVYNYKGEGEQYEYFKTKANRIMGPLNVNTGKGIFYWSRSPAQSYDGYNGINGSGEGDGNGYYCSVGIVPMFVIG